MSLTVESLKKIIIEIPNKTAWKIESWILRAMIKESEKLEADNLRLRNELSQAETTRVGLLGEIEGLKSQGPYSVENGMVLCKDTLVYFNPAFPEGIAEKLNTMQADNLRLRKAIEEAPCDCITRIGHLNCCEYHGHTDSCYEFEEKGHADTCWKRNALEGK